MSSLWIPSLELQHQWTSASLSCLRGYYSNMSPGTVKKGYWFPETLKTHCKYPQVEVNSTDRPELTLKYYILQ